MADGSHQVLLISLNQLPAYKENGSSKLTPDGSHYQHGTLTMLWISPSRVPPRSGYLLGQPLHRSPLVNPSSVVCSSAFASLLICPPPQPKIHLQQKNKSTLHKSWILTGFFPACLPLSRNSFRISTWKQYRRRSGLIHSLPAILSHPSPTYLPPAILHHTYSKTHIHSNISGLTSRTYLFSSPPISALLHW